MRAGILVTGGQGFLGAAVRRRLEEANVHGVIAPRSSEFDLRNPAEIERLLEKAAPKLLVHLAATVGGIGANMEHPGKFFYENAVMGIHLIEEARKAGVEKLVLVGTVCSYPKHTPVPFREDDFWNGYPEETNAPYGIAKKALLVQAQAYRQEYGLNSIYLVPVNLYGPGDNFDPQTSHVIPALIRKFVEATKQKRSVVEAWGTGTASREFLYVDDAAEAITLAMERYNEPEPVNLGSSFEITVRELAELIAQLTGFTGEIRWDRTKPDGQPRRKLDVSRAREAFGFEASTDFETGLKTTIDWYLNQSY